MDDYQVCKRLCVCYVYIVLGMWWCIFMCVSLAYAQEQQEIIVERHVLQFDTEYTYVVNSSIEYILEFVPSAEQSEWPARVHASLGPLRGRAAGPVVLLTARQGTGAQSWQLPMKSVTGDDVTQFERTLCPLDLQATGSEDCVESVSSGQVSLHVMSPCRQLSAVTLRVGGVGGAGGAGEGGGWALRRGQPTDALATLWSPAVRHYMFSASEESVRLVVTSPDDVCALVAVQNYTCPIPQTQADIGVTGLRMTMLGSGAVYLSRRQYPLGFIVVLVVVPREQCQSPIAHSPTTTVAPPAAPLQKNFTITVHETLSYRQYWVASSVTLAVFLSFYVAFGALVFAQRWPAWLKLVGPRPRPHQVNAAEALQLEGGATPRERRRGSNATFDSCDNSESDSEQEAKNTSSPALANGREQASPVTVSTAGSPDLTTDDQTQIDQPQNGNTTSDTDQANVVEERATRRPFNLPPRLVLSSLARRPARTLAARAARYRHTLYTVALFYALPVVQFVTAFQFVLNVSGSLDLCYYNYQCSLPLGALSDFNHVLSNAGYLLLGALFLLQVRRRRARRRREPCEEGFGIPPHFGLHEALGGALMVVALLSASYHVCPNQLNFQFDTSFMYVLSVLCMVKIYQSRHPDINARAHSTFGVLAVLMAFVVWGVLGGGALFWALWSCLHVITFLVLSLRIYYVGQFRLDKQSLAETRRELFRLRPLYGARLGLLLVANAVNWLLAGYGLWTQATDFAGHLLTVLLSNTLLYMVFYLSMKLASGERLRWYSWLFLGGATLAWGPALYFFTSGSSNWAASPAESRLLNHPCKVLQFYDSHDLWHALSALALYLSFNAMLTWDDGLSDVSRDDILVF